MPPRFTKDCDLCKGRITLKRWKKSPVNTCMAATARPANQCWTYSKNPLLAECAKSQRTSSGVELVDPRTVRLLRRLGVAIRSGLESEQAFLKSISPDDRYFLIQQMTLPLAAHLSEVMAGMETVAVHPKQRSPIYPPDLPPGLLEPLQQFQQSLEARAAAKLKAGHSISEFYVRRAILPAIRLAEFLHKNGIDRFDAMRQRDIVSHLAENPMAVASKISRFERFLNDHKPWKETRGRPSRFGGRGRTKFAVPPPDVFLPQEVDTILEGIKEKHSDAEYVVAWMVCKMGIALSDAMTLTPRNFDINESGKLVFRPAQIWLTVPHSIERRLSTIIDQACPGWRDQAVVMRPERPVFRPAVGTPVNLGKRLLGGQSRKLRASALYAWMLRGYTDRITLNMTTGASIPYLEKIEKLLSIDTHCRLSPELVKARNDHLMGKANE